MFTLQAGQLFLSLHTFSSGCNIEGAAQRNHGLQNCQIAFVAINIGDETAVNFDLIKGKGT